jgi:hypothetical protein
MCKELKLWKTLNRENLLTVDPWFEVWKEEVLLPDGRIIPDFYKIDLPDSCVIIALRRIQRNKYTDLRDFGLAWLMPIDLVITGHWNHSFLPPTFNWYNYFSVSV